VGIVPVVVPTCCPRPDTLWPCFGLDAECRLREMTGRRHWTGGGWWPVSVCDGCLMANKVIHWVLLSFHRRLFRRLLLEAIDDDDDTVYDCLERVALGFVRAGVTRATRDRSFADYCCCTCAVGDVQQADYFDYLQEAKQLVQIRR
jgi:hypothetical protein